MKVRKTARIRPESIQSSTTPVPGTKWGSNNITLNIINVSPFPSGNHKAAVNRRKSMAKTRPKNNRIDPQNKYRLGTVSKNILLDGFNQFHGAQTSP